MNRKRRRNLLIPIMVGIPFLIMGTIAFVWGDDDRLISSPGGLIGVGYVATPTPLPPPRSTGLRVDELIEEPGPEPRMYISATVWDAELNIQLLADVYIVESAEFRMPNAGELVQASINQIGLSTPPKFRGWLVTRREGFNDARIPLDYDLSRSKMIHGTIDMYSVRPRFWGDDINPKQ